MERHNIPDKHIDRKLQALVERLTEDFTDKQVGHCIRVDYLSHEEGVLSCQKFRDLWRDAEREHDVTAFVLTSGEPDEIHIPSDRAIEIRNRKSSSLCLFVPADMKDVAVSSLGNSFSPFDISSFLKNLREHLRAEIPEPIADEVNAALRQLRGGAAVSVEQVIEFLSTVLDNPTLETVGIELWRIGLIPDLTPGLDEFVRRVDLNRLCVDKLARPSRPYSSVADRVTTLALKTGTIQADLTEYLLGKRLQSDRTWLKDLAKGSNLGSLTFERWEFPEVEPSDLETIEVAPFYINDVLRPNCGLVQEMAGTMPYAPCGPKKAVTVKWESAPKKPLDVAQWRVEMIPDTEKYEYNDMSAIELPSIIVRGSLRTAKVSLDVDISTVDVREVQIRVTALDANGSEIHSVEDNDAIEGLSQSFYLEQDSGIDSDALKRRKLPVERCLCDALVKLALTAKQPLPKPSPLDCEEKEQVYFPFLVGDRTVIRVVTTQFLRKLQASTLAIPATGGRYRAIPSGVDVLKHENVETIPLQIREQALSTAWEKFLRDRKTAFNGLSVQNKGGLIETAEITDSISKAVRNYAKSYCELLESAMELEVDKSDLTAETIHNLLGLDTLTLELKHLPGRPQATVVLPTHPLRLLWYVAYVEWVAKITKELERVPQSQRKARFSDQNLARICPYNLPAIRVTEKVTGGAIFAENLNLFYAVLLPVGAKDPGALLSEVARVLGFDDFTTSLTGISPEDIASEIREYMNMHPYLDTLRINIVNPGSGEFVREALEKAMSPSSNASEEEMSGEGIGLEVITHTGAEVQTPAPGLEALASDWYRRGGQRRGDHLRPGIQVARRLLTIENLRNLPGGDTHLALCLDYFKPRLGLTTPGIQPLNTAKTTSASMYGLLTHFFTRFQSHEGLATWERSVQLGGDRATERHPANHAFTDILIEAQEAYLQLNGLALHKQTGEPWQRTSIPTVCLDIGHEERRLIGTLHEFTDWVLTVDRHFGVEYFDTPNDPYLSTQSHHYLLDYTPEFIDGLGHRLLVTTECKEEVADILGRAMLELGLSNDEESCNELLMTLETISGRLALRLVGEGGGDNVGLDTLAKETVSLAVVANYLRRKGELNDTIVVPLDAHQRLFLDAKNSAVTHSSSRCDMLLVRPIKQRLFIDFVEVKYRSGDDVVSASLLDQMADQTQITDNAVRGLYFSDPPRLDAPILRCQLAAILRFYAERAYRHGRMGSEQKYIELLDNIGRVEMGLTRMTPRHRGFIVNLNGRPHKPIKRDDITVQVLTGIEIDRDTDFVRNSNVAETTEPVSVSPDVDAPAPMEPDGNSAIVEQLNTAEDGGNESKLRTVTEVSPKEDKVSPLTIPDPETEDTNKEPMTVGEDDFEERNQSAYINSQHEIVMPLGEDDDSGQPVSWVGAVKGSPHLFIMGIPGQGKSWSVLRLISEASRLDVPSLILDFHGQFATPESPFTKSVKPTILSVAEGLPFSPFEISATVSGASNSWKMNAFQVSEILQYVCDLGEMQRDLVYEAIHDSYMEAGYDDPSQTDAQPPSMASVYKHLKELEQERRGAKNTVARVRPLFEFGLFQDTAENIDFASLYTNTSIIDLHGVSMETMQIAAGAFVLRKVYKDMFTWGESDRLRLLVVLDEAHRLAKDITLPKLMKEGRKYGIAIIVASQTMNDFHSEVLQNAGTKVLFRTNFPQSKRVIGCVKPPHYIADLSTTLENLAVGRALVQTPDMSSCAVVSMYPYQP